MDMRLTDKSDSAALHKGRGVLWITEQTGFSSKVVKHDNSPHIDSKAQGCVFFLRNRNGLMKWTSCKYVTQDEKEEGDDDDDDAIWKLTSDAVIIINAILSHSEWTKWHLNLKTEVMHYN